MKNTLPLSCAAILLLGVSAIVGQVDYPQEIEREISARDVPKEAKKTGLGGRVQLRLRIDAAGKVVSAEVQGGPADVCPSITRPDVVAIRNSAEGAARKMRFPPAMADGKAVESIMTLQLDFPTTKTESVPVVGETRGRLVEMGEPGEGVKVVNPDGSPMRTISGGVLNGRAIKLPKPRYPPAAIAVRAGGSVPIEVLIDTDGSIFSARAVQGHPFLRSAARMAACDSRFPPTLLSGQPVQVSGIITYNFVP